MATCFIRLGESWPGLSIHCSRDNIRTTANSKLFISYCRVKRTFGKLVYIAGILSRLQVLITGGLVSFLLCCTRPPSLPFLVDLLHDQSLSFIYYRQLYRSTRSKDSLGVPFIQFGVPGIGLVSVPVG